MSTDNRFGAIIDYHGQRPCNDPMVLGRLMDRLCQGKAPTLAERVVRGLAIFCKGFCQGFNNGLRKKLTR